MQILNALLKSKRRSIRDLVNIMDSYNTIAANFSRRITVW